MNEREKQEVIVRQSQLKFVMDYAKMINVNLTLTEMVRISRVLTTYVMNGYNDKTLDLLEKADKLIKDKFDEE